MKRLLQVALVLLLLVLLAGGWLIFSLYAPHTPKAAGGVLIDIPHGSSVRGIASLLAEKGAIRSRLAFLLLARRHPNKRLEAGEYLFNRPENTFQVFDDLANGRVYTIAVTVPEGFNSLQIANLLQQAGLVERDTFLAALHDTSSIRDLAPTAPSVEGFLFPSTYQFPHHITPQQVINTMTAHFRAEWNSLVAQDPPPAASAKPAAMIATPAKASTRRQNQGSANQQQSQASPPLLHTPQQIVTLASLVESETPKPEERPIVAAVFLNRLKIGLPLQCDPTVIYALELAGKYTPPLRGSDLGFDSAYNTYRHAGLPPGPISNPGEASLRAALQPAAVDYLYFVADTQGGHLFSRTLDEHNRNVARYRRLLNGSNR